MGFNKISNRIYFMDYERESDRPVLGFIKGDKYCLAVDAGNSKAHKELFYKYLDEHKLPLPDYTIITHYHWDHTFAMHSIHGKSLVLESCNKKLEDMKTWIWTNEEMYKRIEQGLDIEFCREHIVKEYEDLSEIKVTTGDLLFKYELVLNLGGIECILKHIPSPHTDDAVIVYIPSEKVLFVGDAGYGDFNYLDGAFDKLKLKSYIEVIESLDFEKYIISHDEIETKESILESLKNELNSLL